MLQNGSKHGHPFFFQEGNRIEPGKTLRHKIPRMAIYVIIETICENHGLLYIYSLLHFFFISFLIFSTYIVSIITMLRFRLNHSIETFRLRKLISNVILAYLVFSFSFRNRHFDFHHICLNLRIPHSLMVCISEPLSNIMVSTCTRTCYINIHIFIKFSPKGFSVNV